MLFTEVLAFARASLPPPPATVLEIGAGSGELAAALAGAGYAITAIDPGAEAGSGVQRLSLLEASGRFDAALAVVSLHHLDPLERSMAHLATLIAPGGPLLIDEFDVDRLDERASAWWLAQRQASGGEEPHDPSTHVATMRGHIHPLATLIRDLTPYFSFGEPIRGPYLYRWNLGVGLRDAEERLIAAGELPATGARLVGVRR